MLIWEKGFIKELVNFEKTFYRVYGTYSFGSFGKKTNRSVLVSASGEEGGDL